MSPLFDTWAGAQNKLHRAALALAAGLQQPDTSVQELRRLFDEMVEARKVADGVVLGMIEDRARGQGE
jgi:hypothetical protein